MRYYNQNATKNKMKADFVQQPHGYNWWWWCHNIEDHYYSNDLRCFRKIRTTNEKRQQIAIEDQIEYDVRIRGRRSFRMLPDSWHDICTSACKEEKSWKRNSKRKKQWKYE